MYHIFTKYINHVDIIYCWKTIIVYWFSNRYYNIENNMLFFLLPVKHGFNILLWESVPCCMKYVIMGFPKSSHKNITWIYTVYKYIFIPIYLFCIPLYSARVLNTCINEILKNASKNENIYDILLNLQLIYAL